MDMSKYNEDIKTASDEVFDDGPRFPDGDYLMAVTIHEDKNKDPIPGTDPVEYRQVGLWVTFKILEGPFMGKDYKKYFNLKHATSKACTRFGLSALKKFYTAINFMPVTFDGVYGRRFMATLESTKQDSEEYPWSTDIIAYAVAPAAQGQAMNAAPVVGQAIPADVAGIMGGTVVTPQQEELSIQDVIKANNDQPELNASEAGNGLLSKIDETPSMGFGLDNAAPQVKGSGWDGRGVAPDIKSEDIPF